jgi:hypothetical protein
MGGFPLGYTKSEFYSITSAGDTDYQPFDLGGAKQAVIMIDPASTGQGFITNENVAGSDRLVIPQNMTQPLTVFSTDGRLYWVAAAGTSAILNLWVIRG